MSYHTRVEFHFEGNAPAFEEIAECARTCFASGYAVEAITEDLRRGWEQGSAEFSDLLPEDFEGLFRRVSTRFPELAICVRGAGEEWRDFWMREFLGGEIIFTSGPLPGTDRYEHPT